MVRNINGLLMIRNELGTNLSAARHGILPCRPIVDELFDCAAQWHNMIDITEGTREKRRVSYSEEKGAV